MSLFTGKSRRTKRHIALVFDIGSASVAGALVVLARNAKPRVLYSVRKPIVFQEQLSFDRFVSSLFETFTLVVDSIQRKGLEYLNTRALRPDAIASALCTYASPWYTARTRVLTLRKGKPFSVTRSLIDKIVTREREKESAGPGDVIEQSITAIKLNGYTVSAVEGKEAKQLELTLSTTMLSEEVARGLEGILAQRFYRSPVHHHSFPLAAFTAIRDITHDGDNFLVLDVSGEVSDVSLVKDGALLETASFPLGKHQILRRFMGNLGLGATEAQSLLRMYAESATALADAAQTQAAILTVQDEWSRAFTEALERIERNMPLPRTLFFISDRDYARLVRAFIEATDTRSRFEVREIDQAMLQEHVDFSSGHGHDPFIGIGAFFSSKITNL